MTGRALQISLVKAKAGQEPLTKRNSMIYFDRVPHSRFLTKLASLGIGALILRWIERSLAVRAMAARLGSEISDWRGTTELRSWAHSILSVHKTTVPKRFLRPNTSYGVT